MGKCSFCGASFEKGGLRCPYCGSPMETITVSSHNPSFADRQGTARMPQGLSVFKAEAAEGAAGRTVTHIEIEPHVLDVMAIGALEVSPKETAGILFGREYGGLASVRQAQVIQEALIRSAYSTAPSPISEDRIAEAQSRVTDLDLLGSYHSHPYFLQAFGRREDGLRLSEGDVAYFSRQPWVRLELVLGCFPWQIWEACSGFARWQEAASALAGSDGTPATVTILCRSLDYAIPSEQLVAAINQAVALAQKGGEAGYAEMMAREMEVISKFREIRGFDVLVAGHARTPSGFEPVSLRLGYTPSAARCPGCGASLGTGEVSCRFCGASF